MKKQEPRNYRAVLLTASIILLLASCGGGSAPSSGPAIDSSRDLEIFYTKGPVDKAMCTLYDKDGNVLANPKPSNKGIVKFQNVAKTDMVFLECSGGEYADEATNRLTSLENVTMRSGGSTIDDNPSIVVSPLTEIAYQLSSIDNDLTDFKKHCTDVADEFGVDGIDITSSYPSTLEDLAQGPAEDAKHSHKYGIILATISQKMDNESTSIDDFIDDTFVDIASDGNIDESLVSLQQALSDLSNNPNTSSAIDGSATFAFGEDDNVDPISENPDDDGDGTLDVLDAFPFQSDETTDTDGDSIGNNADPDDDNDDVPDTADAFPTDWTESVDTDNDNIGDNADIDDDNDNVIDSVDAFPFDPNEYIDTDGDGIGNQAESTPDDLDGDGHANINDPYPQDPTRSDLESPVLKTSVDDQTIILGWQRLDVSATYNLYYSTDASTLSNLVYDDVITDLGGTLHAITGLTNDTVYYCMLEAVFNDQVKSQSSIVSARPNPRWYAFSTPNEITTEAPSIVVSTQRVVDRRTGEPVTGLLNQPDGSKIEVGSVFQIFEDGGSIFSTESFLDSEPLGNIPTTIKTALMLDISSSISISELQLEVQAALNIVRKPVLDGDGNIVTDANGQTVYETNLYEGQQIAIYTFDDTVELIQDFTADHNVLTNAIFNLDTTARVNATNLYGAVVEGFSRLENHFSLDAVTYSYMLMITDGDDTAGFKTLANAITAKGDLSLFVVAVGQDVNLDALTQLVLGEALSPITAENRAAAMKYLFEVEVFSALDSQLKEVAEDASSFGDGIYLLYYATPAQTGAHTVEISLLNNNETCSQTWIDLTGECLVTLTGEFDSSNFSGVAPELIVTSEEVLEVGKTYKFSAKTRWTNDTPNYQWRFNNLNTELLYEVSADTSELTISVPTSLNFETGEIQVIDMNTTTIFQNEITENTLIGNIPYQAGQGLFIKNQSNGQAILLDVANPTVSLEAIRIPGNGLEVYNWSIADPSLVSISSPTGSSITLSRNANYAGSTTLTLTEENSGIAKLFDVTVEYGLHHIEALSSGSGTNSCVINSSDVVCWGSSFTGINNVPVDLNNPTMMGVGANNACVLDSYGIHCWGRTNTGINSVPILTAPVQISVGDSNACAIDNFGLKCWGGSSIVNSVPSLDNPYLVSVGDAHACAADDTGIHCWGSDPLLNDYFSPASLVSELTSGRVHSCAIVDGSLDCWGKNDFGQINFPQNIASPQLVKSGGYHNCILAENGISCWGQDSFGETLVPDVAQGASFIGVGRDYSCAANIDEVICWGGEANDNIPE